MPHKIVGSDLESANSNSPNSTQHLVLRRLAALVGNLVTDQAAQEVLAHGRHVPALRAQAAPRPDRFPEVRGVGLLRIIHATTASFAAGSSRRQKSRLIRSRC